MKAKYAHIVCLLVMLVAFPSLSDADEPLKRLVPSIRNVEKAVTEETLRSGVEFLSDTLWRGRMTQSRGSCEAAFWVARQFKRWGLIPFGEGYVKNFIASGGRSGHNVIGMLPGMARYGGKGYASRGYIVVGAHYDNIGEISGTVYPGADSNASGVVAMVTLARMFRYMIDLGREYGRTVIFVAFDAKDLSMGGSSAFCRALNLGQLKDPLTGKVLGASDIHMMVNIDQIGSTLSPLKSGRKDYMLMLSGYNSSLMSSMTAANNGIGMDLCFDYYGSRDFTNMFYYRIGDQKAFVENGISSVLLTSGITMLNNKTSDTAQSLDYEVMRRRLILIFKWLSIYA